MLENITSETLISLITLSLLEVILGIDNIVFISILSGKLPEAKQKLARRYGLFIGMLYGRHSSLVFKYWVRYALLMGRPWKSFANVIWNRMESIGTKSYTVAELEKMFSNFKNVELIPTITKYDTDHWPQWLSKFFPDSWGWYIGVRAKK
jgi:hypothetical protein